MLTERLKIHLSTIFTPPGKPASVFLKTGQVLLESYRQLTKMEHQVVGVSV